MNTESLIGEFKQTTGLLRGDLELTARWTREWSVSRLLLYIGLIVLGAGLFGAAIGSWRNPLQSSYAAVKLPLVILLTTFGNALINGMLAPLLGLNITFRQSILAILMSFTIAGLILGAFSPILFFVVWNAPPMTAHGEELRTAYSIVMVTQVCMIAFAGIAANLRLLQLFGRLGGNAWVAKKILFAWLAGNLFLGAQLSWILRPFVGSPGLPTQFIRPTAFQGNFYEAIWHALKNLF